MHNSQFRRANKELLGRPDHQDAPTIRSNRRLNSTSIYVTRSERRQPNDSRYRCRLTDGSLTHIRSRGKPAERLCNNPKSLQQYLSGPEKCYRKTLRLAHRAKQTSHLNCEGTNVCWSSFGRTYPQLLRRH